MYTEFHLNASELDNNFLKKVKKLFGSKSISIIIEEEPDETEYLLKSEANRKTLLESIKQFEDGRLVKVKIGKISSKYWKLNFLNWLILNVIIGKRKIKRYTPG